jgi:hypothetical protein
LTKSIVFIKTIDYTYNNFISIVLTKPNKYLPFQKRAGMSARLNELNIWRKNMNTRSTIHDIAAIVVLTLNTAYVATIQADTTENANGLYYTNRAYVHAIAEQPNPIADEKIQDAEIVYVDKAYGQAIYSYPSNVNNTVTAFNVEYIDTAFGQAIYSYPNNTSKHHLDLVENAVNTESGDIVPVVLKLDNIPIRAARTVH